MATKYIINNVTGQTITGGLSISGGTTILSTPPTYLSGSTGDKLGQIAFDKDYLYYCTKNFTEGDLTITNGGTTHVLNKELGQDWNTYGGNYLQGGNFEGSETPQAGWYIVDDLGTVRQVLSDPVWFSGGNPTPIQNGNGWFMVLDGPFVIDNAKTSIIFYETLPSVDVVEGSGDCWKTVKLESTLNTTGNYKALLTQTGSISGNNINNFNYGLIIGETYTINNYVSGDDFSNIANVISGNINESNCVFIATGETPSNWFNGSELVSQGYLVVNELENSLGFEVYWIENPMGAPGFYFAFNNTTGPFMNSFPRQTTTVKAQNNGFLFGGSNTNIVGGVGSISGKDDIVYVGVYDFDIFEPIQDALYYTPVEITMKQDLDVTPIDVYGSTTSFPFSNVAYTMYCGENSLYTMYSYDNTTVNNMDELISLLNNSSNTNQIGVFSAGGEGGIKLTINKNLENQLCPDSELTFWVFND